VCRTRQVEGDHAGADDPGHTDSRCYAAQARPGAFARCDGNAGSDALVFHSVLASLSPMTSVFGRVIWQGLADLLTAL
jgi:hypothetical protein